MAMLPSSEDEVSTSNDNSSSASKRRSRWSNIAVMLGNHAFHRDSSIRKSFSIDSDAKRSAVENGPLGMKRTSHVPPSLEDGQDTQDRTVRKTLTVDGSSVVPWSSSKPSRKSTMASNGPASRRGSIAEGAQENLVFSKSPSLTFSKSPSLLAAQSAQNGRRMTMRDLGSQVQQIVRLTPGKGEDAKRLSQRSPVSEHMMAAFHAVLGLHHHDDSSSGASSSSSDSDGAEPPPLHRTQSGGKDLVKSPSGSVCAPLSGVVNDSSLRRASISMRRASLTGKVPVPQHEEGVMTVAEQMDAVATGTSQIAQQNKTASGNNQGEASAPADVRYLAVRNARIIQNLIQEAGDEASRYHERWVRKKTTRDLQAAHRVSFGMKPVEERIENETKKTASRLKKKRHVSIAARLMPASQLDAQPSTPLGRGRGSIHAALDDASQEQEKHGGPHGLPPQIFSAELFSKQLAPLEEVSSACCSGVNSVENSPRKARIGVTSSSRPSLDMEIGSGFLRLDTLEQDSNVPSSASQSRQSTSPTLDDEIHPPKRHRKHRRNSRRLSLQMGKDFPLKKSEGRDNRHLSLSIRNGFPLIKNEDEKALPPTHMGRVHEGSSDEEDSESEQPAKLISGKRFQSPEVTDHSDKGRFDSILPGLERMSRQQSVALSSSQENPFGSNKADGGDALPSLGQSAKHMLLEPTSQHSLQQDVPGSSAANIFQGKSADSQFLNTLANEKMGPLMRGMNQMGPRMREMEKVCLTPTKDAPAFVAGHGKNLGLPSSPRNLMEGDGLPKRGLTLPALNSVASDVIQEGVPLVTEKLAQQEAAPQACAVLAVPSPEKKLVLHRDSLAYAYTHGHVKKKNTLPGVGEHELISAITAYKIPQLPTRTFQQRERRSREQVRRIFGSADSTKDTDWSVAALAASNAKRGKLPEIPRLREKFRDRRVILGNNWRDECVTVKRFHLEVAARLGLEEKDWNFMGSIYEISVSDLKLAAEQKEEKEKHAAAARLQHLWRSKRICEEAKKARHEKIAALRLLQNWWHMKNSYQRPVQARVDAKPHFMKAVVKIQASFLGWHVRRQLAFVRDMRAIGSQMESLRQDLGGDNAEKLVKVQAWMRGFLARRKFIRVVEGKRQQQEERERAAEMCATSRSRSDKRRQSFMQLTGLDVRRGTLHAPHPGWKMNGNRRISDMPNGASERDHPKAFPLQIESRPKFYPSPTDEPELASFPNLESTPNLEKCDSEDGQSDKDSDAGVRIQTIDRVVSMAPLAEQLKKPLKAGYAHMGGLQKGHRALVKLPSAPETHYTIDSIMVHTPYEALSETKSPKHKSGSPGKDRMRRRRSSANFKKARTHNRASVQDSAKAVGKSSTWSPRTPLALPSLSDQAKTNSKSSQDNNSERFALIEKVELPKFIATPR